MMLYSMLLPLTRRVARAPRVFVARAPRVFVAIAPYVFVGCWRS